jgi:hypothetical protein
LVVLTKSAAKITAADKDCPGTAGPHKRRLLSTVYYRGPYSQGGGFTAKALFPRKTVNAAVSGTEAAGAVKICHFVIIPSFFAPVTRSFYSTLFNEKMVNLPLYSTKK